MSKTSDRSSKKNAPDPDSWGPSTKLVHGGTLRSQFGETSEALFLTQGFVYDSAEQAEARFKNEEPGYLYSRFSNPTVSMFEERVRLMEGAQGARATATGMAAVTASLLCYLKAGDHIVSARALFGSCRFVIEEILPRYGIETTLVHGADLDQWKAAVKPNTKAFFFETPANPTLELVDIAEVCDVARETGAISIVDNVFATPVLQRPLEHGADVVVYSATKHIDGQGRCLGGAVLGSSSYIDDHLHNFLRQTGPAMSPFNAWVMIKGLETLRVRVAGQCKTAEKFAEHLSGLPEITRVLYPFRDDFPQVELAKKQMGGGGQIVTLIFDGDKAQTFAFLNALRLIRISNNLGDVKSLVTHPATTTHQRLKPEARAELGITDGMVRISVGLEDIEDLIADVENAIWVAKKSS